MSEQPPPEQQDDAPGPDRGQEMTRRLVQDVAAFEVDPPAPERVSGQPDDAADEPADGPATTPGARGPGPGPPAAG